MRLLSFYCTGAPTTVIDLSILTQRAGRFSRGNFKSATLEPGGGNFITNSQFRNGGCGLCRLRTHLRRRRKKQPNDGGEQYPNPGASVMMHDLFFRLWGMK